jgi:hypothetical protein
MRIENGDSLILRGRRHGQRLLWRYNGGCGTTQGTIRGTTRGRETTGGTIVRMGSCCHGAYRWTVGTGKRGSSTMIRLETLVGVEEIKSNEDKGKNCEKEESPLAFILDGS